MDDHDSVAMWVELARAGDADAQRALWERFFPELVRLARLRLQGAPRRVADEEDVALSVFQSFFRGAQENRFPDLRGGDSLWRLLSRMTHRKAIDALRRSTRQKRRSVGESALAGADTTGRAGLDGLPAAAPTPLLELIVADECRRLLELLKPELRQIALLKLDGYSNQEIADRQACSLATVERRLKLIREIWSAN